MATDPNDGPVCSCMHCRAAGVDDRPTRWVPCPQGRRQLHGVELRVWYEKRDAFFAKLHRAPIAQQLALAAATSNVLPFKPRRRAPLQDLTDEEYHARANALREQAREPGDEQ